MQIINASVVVLKNRPMSAQEREGKDRAAKSLPEKYSVFIEVIGDDEGEVFAGLGEARPTRASDETLASATRYARKMARCLVGRTLRKDSESPVREVNDITDEIICDISGIGNNGIIERRPNPSVCFAAECAVLDLMARHRGVSITELDACPNKGSVQRNVFNDPLRDIEKLLPGIDEGKQLQGWLRLGRRISGDEAAALINSLMFTLGDGSPDLSGIILNAGQRWSPAEWEEFCDSLNLTDLLAKPNISVVVEDPFPEDADTFYQQAFEKIEGSPIRIMLSAPVWGPESIKKLAPYLPHVDLKVIPQRVGGYHDVLEAEREAQAHGFKGGIFLAGVNGTTNLNTLAMVSLAGAMCHCRYFSTSFRKEDKVRLVYPHAELDDNVIRLPEGPGFAANLCRSGVRRRLVSINAYDADGSIRAGSARRALLERVYDDRALHPEVSEK